MASAHLDAAIGSTDIPDAARLLNRSVLTGGKFLRPALCYRAASLLDVELASVRPFAEAAERVHNATLIHDDVIDESRERRRRPTLNASGHNRRAVLAGDLLLALAMREVGKTGHLAAVQAMQQALVELVEGEWLQLEARGEVAVDDRHLRKVARKKTGSLLAWCCEAPALLSGDPSEMAPVFREFGLHLGVAFQMVDDCVDFSPTSGKPWAQDLREGQVNFVTLEMVHAARGLGPGLRAILGTDFAANAVPWAPAQLTAALAEVRRKAELELEIGLAKLRGRVGPDAPAGARNGEAWGELQALAAWFVQRTL